MARYNTVLAVASIAGGNTISTPNSGLFTTLTGTGTVNIPSPALYLGSTQVYYNSTGASITLSTPIGVINGPGLGGGSATLNLPAGSIITLVSDGTNYLTQDWLGGNVSAATLSSSGAVNLSPATGTVTINPTSAGSISNMSGSFTSLSASSPTTLTNAGAATSYNSAGASLLVSGGVGIAGAVYTNSTVTTGGALTVSTGGLTLTTGNATVTSGNLFVTSGKATINYSTSGGLNPTLYVYNTASNVGAGAWESTSGLVVGQANNNGDTSVFIGSDNGSSRYGWIGAVNKSTAYTTLALNPSNTGNIAVGGTSAGVSLDISNRTDAIALPRGNTAQRPASPVAGYLRMNTQTSYAEFYNGSAWQSIAGPYTVTYLVVAGGGGGGTNGPGPGYGSGGGAGGVLTGTFLATPGQQYTVTIGNGGSYPSTSSSTGTNGGASSISGGTLSVSTVGGGGGASPSSLVGQPGGSGGGAGATAAGAGSGTSGQGNPGGNTAAPGNGGGGWGQAGNTNGTEYGGDGQSSSITGTPTYYGGGGGGGGPTTQFPGGNGCLLYTSPSPRD